MIAACRGGSETVCWNAQLMSTDRLARKRRVGIGEGGPVANSATI